MRLIELCLFGRFMLVIYNLLIYILLILLSPVWIVILLSKKKCRAGFKQKCGFFAENLKQAFKSMPTRPVWFHAVSVGFYFDHVCRVSVACDRAGPGCDSDYAIRIASESAA